MELLAILESRVSSLVEEIKFLRNENAQLRTGTANSTVLKAENSHLKRILAEEQQRNAATLERIERILALTQDVAQHKPGVPRRVAERNPVGGGNEKARRESPSM